MKTTNALISASIFAILSVASFAPASAADAFKVVGIANGDSLNVRSGAGTQFSDIGDVALGQIVQVNGVDNSGKWAMITWQGGQAYVSTRYLEPVGFNSGNAQGLGMHKVTGILADDTDGGLVIRNGPGTSYARILVVPNNVSINIVEISADGKWSRGVFSDGGTGWMRNSYLVSANTNPTPPTPPNNPQQNNIVLPAVFTVVNVAPNDVLWVRNGPDANSAPVTNLQPNAPVSVLEFTNNGWAKVTIGQNVGYVKANFLVLGGGITTPNGMQLGLNCNGTEPFWNLQVAIDGTMSFEALGGSGPSITALQVVTPSQSGYYPFQFSDNAQLNGTLTPQACSDGMSDIAYPWAILLNAPVNGSMMTLNGCCTLQ